MKNRSQTYDLDRPRPRHGHNYTNYKMCFSMMMVICIKQHLSNILSSTHVKEKQIEAELKKGLLIKNVPTM